MALIGICWLLLQTNTVQNWVTNKALSWISEKTDHDFSIASIRIAWFDELEVNGFELKDYNDSTLASVNNIRLNYDLWELIETRKLELQSLEMREGSLRLLNHRDSSEMNLNVFLASLKNLSGSEEDTDEDSTKSEPMGLSRLSLERFKVGLHDYNKPRAIGKADFNHIDLNIDRIEINDLLMKPDSISLSFDEFKGSDAQNGIFIDEFRSEIAFTDKNLILDDLAFSTPTSSFGDSVALSYESPEALSNFVEEVEFYLHMDRATISATDVENILGSPVIKKDVSVTTVLKGKANDLAIEDLILRYGSSRLRADATIVGLPAIEDTFVDFGLSNSRVYKRDVKPYLGAESQLLDGIDWFDLSISFSGFLNDFSTKGTVQTNYGGIGADMNITIPDDFELAAYTGHLELKDLHVGRLIGDTTSVQQVSMKGRILGKGITPEKASFLTDLTGHNVNIMNYEYDSLSFKGYLAAKHFYGQFAVVDPNCKVKGRTNVDLRTVPEQLSLSVAIDTLMPKNLNLVDDDIFLSTNLNWKQTHLNPDSLSGMLLVLDTQFAMDTTRTLKLDSISVATNVDSTFRTVDVSLPGVVMDLDGNYTFKNLASFLSKEVADLKHYFELGSADVIHEEVAMQAQMNAKIGDLSPYLDYFKPGVVVSEDAEFNMFFEQKPGSDGVVSLYAFIDSMVYNGDVFLDNEVDIYASLDPQNEDILASFLVSSREQRWKAIPYSEAFQVEGVWVNDKIEIATHMLQPDTDTRAHLEAEMAISSDSIEFSFKPSELVALGRKWSFDPGNYINFSKRGLLFRSLDLVSENKRASLNGLLSETESSSVNFVARNIDLHQFNSVLNIPVEGVFEADFSVFKVPDHPVQFAGKFDLFDFEYKDDLIGDIHGQASYDLNVDGIKTGLSVARKNVETISLEGYYYPEKREQLDFKLKFDKADFQMLEVVTTGNLSDLEGTTSGELTIKGSTDEPKVSGIMDLNDLGYKVEYLKTVYDMNGRIKITPKSIELQNFILRDPDGDIATLKGNIKHNNFQDIVTDLHINARTFNFLNTTAKDNELYYGTANATGDIYITGPFEDLVLKVNAKTEKGTRFYIPLSDSETYEQADFMTFVNFSDTTHTAGSALDKLEQGLGLTIDFDLEVTNDAYCELIFDIKTGDIIRGRGSGNLKLKLDKNGNFELFGPLTIEEGGYNFTLNVINKEFQVVPGSTITWYGDPYSGTMDMVATYRQSAAFSGLTGQSDDAEMNQKLPLNVLLELTGEMLTPTIDFDITLDESATSNREITSLLAQVRGDEQQLKRQVISLMFLKRFSPMQDGFVGGGGSGASIGKSLSEFLTNQISYLASQLDENLEIEVDLADLDDSGFQTFQLRLAYTFLDGRLKVTRGGDFASANGSDETSVNDIIGDWSVEYMLTPDGKLRAKMFSQSSQTQISSDGSQSLERGLSLKYVTSFNKFKEILARSRSEAIQRKEEEEADQDSGTE